MIHNHYDVVILGGGLAGGCLGRQLHMEAPALRTLVVERRSHPVPEAAFKVGESSVEIGAHYFSKRLGLEPHLRSAQLEKLGLRYFFPHGDNRQLTPRVELGPPRFPPVPSFQLDRGRLENMLLRTNAELGVEVAHGCRIQKLTLADGGPSTAGGHEVTFDTAEGARTVTARWVVDASGRAGLIKRQLGLARPSTHGANAAWWRVKTRVKIDDWSSDPEWKARVPSGLRWQSTVHLMGAGYWVWLIPLGSGSHSFGIVADGDMHPFNRINRFERAMDWLREFEPQCAAFMEGLADDLEDFLALKHFAHSCERVFSPARWALVGEAGVFTDPFYSPGSDFIAMGNDYVTDLIVRDFAGDDISERVESFNRMYLRLFDAFIRLYDGQYRIMGNAQVMTAKVAWDNATYWAITALLFFQRRYRRPEFIASIDFLLRRFFVLHARMQSFFRAWDLADEGSRYAWSSANVVDVEFLRRLQASLGDPLMDDDGLRVRLEENLQLLEAFARTWQSIAAMQEPQLARFVSAAADPDRAELDVSALRLSLARLPA
ncbi:MAG TPA: FAD-dependent monooxygenase [Vicinamibacterales bacterium]|nr:FAD-dependent monooxygenase [Vicinamibacterales bacterium]